MTKGPNFLFIIADQLRADWLGCTGHKVVKTPNIDSIAANGTVFKDFHVAQPVCMPNRASLMTGRMPSVHGLRYNGCTLPHTANTFVDVLAKAGYNTATIGKNHHQPFTDFPPQRTEDPQERLIEEAWTQDPHAYTAEEPARFAGETDNFPKPYYGFQHVDMVTGHGDQCGGHYQQWFRNNVPNWQALHDPANQIPHTYTCPQAFRTSIAEEDYPTAWIGDRAKEYLDIQTGSTEPFFAFVSFPDPHHPFNPPGKYWDMYDPEDFSVDLPYEAHKNPTPPLQSVSQMRAEGIAPATPQTAFRAEDRDLKEAMALTAGMITMIDDQVGKLIQALKENGQYENTVIIFTSDHGDYMGDFNLLLKGPLALQSITRVPMIWSDPASRVAIQTDALASTIDLSASILERAELAPYFGIQGKSFLKSLDGTHSHRKEVLIEHNDGGPRMGFEKPARVRTLRTKDWRFSMYAGEGWGELYDLQADPKETHNLWDEPAAAQVKAALSLRLVEQLTFQMDESPRATRLA